jgi:peptide deformylase
MVKILSVGHPTLRKVAEPVPPALFQTDALTKIITDMGHALRATEHGVAIAAPQIGVSYRIFLVAGFVVAGNERNYDDPDMVFINPTITRRSRKKVVIDGEGCLSVPHVYGTITRSQKVTVTAYDESGKKFEYGGSELMAEIFEHEIDHLDGILFIDKATETWRHAKDNEKK